MESNIKSERVFSFHNYKFIFIYRQTLFPKIRVKWVLKARKVYSRRKGKGDINAQEKIISKRFKEYLGSNCLFYHSNHTILISYKRSN